MLSPNTALRVQISLSRNCLQPVNGYSVGDNKSYFTDPNGNPIETSLGSTVLNVVPEPAAIVQILSLIATVPAVLVYRRWKAAK